MFHRVQPLPGGIAAAVVFRAAGVSAISSSAESPEQAVARQILEETGVQGGLIVHLGCGDGRLTAVLGAGPSYLVQGLDADAVNVSARWKQRANKPARD